MCVRLSEMSRQHLLFLGAIRRSNDFPRRIKAPSRIAAGKYGNACTIYNLTLITTEARLSFLLKP